MSEVEPEDRLDPLWAQFNTNDYDFKFFLEEELGLGYESSIRVCIGFRKQIEAIIQEK